MTLDTADILFAGAAALATALFGIAAITAVVGPPIRPLISGAIIFIGVWATIVADLARN